MKKNSKQKAILFIVAAVFFLLTAIYITQAIKTDGWGDLIAVSAVIVFFLPLYTLVTGILSPIVARSLFYMPIVNTVVSVLLSLVYLLLMKNADYPVILSVLLAEGVGITLAASFITWSILRASHRKKDSPDEKSKTA